MTERDDLISALRGASERLDVAPGLSLISTPRGARSNGLREKSRGPRLLVAAVRRPRRSFARDATDEQTLETAASVDELRDELETFAELLEEGESRRGGRPRGASAARGVRDGARALGQDGRARGLTQRLADDPRRRRRHGVAGLGGDAPADVPALRRVARLEGRAHRPAGRRGGRTQERDAPRRRRPRLRLPQGRDGRAPPRAHLAVRRGASAGTRRSPRCTSRPRSTRTSRSTSPTRTCASTRTARAAPAASTST